MMDVENQDTVKCTSNRVVEKDFQTTLNTEKALNHSGQGLFGLYRMSWSFQVAERVEFRFNHPNSLIFIPALALTYIKCIPKMDTFQATFSYVILLHRF